MKKPIIKFEYKTFTLGSEITQEQKDYFKKYGVIQFKNFIDPHTALIFIDELAKIETKWLEEGIQKNQWDSIEIRERSRGERHDPTYVLHK